MTARGAGSALSRNPVSTLATPTRGEQLDQFLGTAIEQLDISPADNERALGYYHDLGTFLADHWADCTAGGCIYPQGSMRLGTVTRVIHRNDEYDLDAVCRRDLAKTSISQAGLKEEVGDALDLFVKSEPDGLPSRDEGKRCWTLHYLGQPFHLDVLPSLPDPDEEPNGIILTDTTLWKWQHSNPIDYADWFYLRMKTEWEYRRAIYAETRDMDVAAVPQWAVKTTLQRSVQALKRHRDIFFAEDLEDRTASIIITTLAATAYRGQGGLYEVLGDIVGKMPGLVEDENGIYTVYNPVQPEENFADRWQTHPRRAKRFFEWMTQAKADFAQVGSDLGLDRVHDAAVSALGERPARRAAEAIGSGLFENRKSGRLGMLAATGTLTVGAGRTGGKHTFHGDHHPTTTRP